MKKILHYITVLALISTISINCHKNQNVEPEVLTGNWKPPIGIPRPSFGIEETYRMYDDVAKRNTALTYLQNNEGGFYTHYVDNTDPNATDNGNNFGSKDKPRATLPDKANVPAGSVIEMHGGTYTIDYQIYTVIGTKEQPVFLRGFSESDRVQLIGGDFYLNCQYFIFENFERTKSGIIIRSFEDNEAHHVGIRNCDVHDFTDYGIAPTCYIDGKTANNIVIYNNHIHPDNFDPNGGTFPENDVIGVYLFQNTSDIWIVDNLIHTASGDAIAAGHEARYTTKSFYIGRNVLHTCGENAVDLKEVENVVVAQNTMYDFQGWSAGDPSGGAAIVHEGLTYSPKNTWFIYNEIYDCSGAAFLIGGEEQNEVYYIGNLIHNISNAKGTAYACATWTNKKAFFINNTIYNCDNGINSSIDGFGVELHIYNNIIANVKAGGIHLYIGGPLQTLKSVHRNNLFYQGGSDINIRFNGRAYADLTNLYDASKLGEGSIIGDPMFVNASTNDFRIQANSPAKDAGIESDIYDRYQSIFGVDIRFDFNGTPRPQNDIWDIGAFEYK